MKSASAIVPVTWALEMANVIARAEAKGLVTGARSEAFLAMLEGGGHRSGCSDFFARLVLHPATGQTIQAVRL